MDAERMKLNKEIITLALPALLEYTLQFSVTYIDYIMVGKLGVKASAVISLSTEVNFFIKGGINAAGIGVLAYIAGKYGEKKEKEVKDSVIQAILLALIVGAVTTILAVGIGPALPGWMGADREIQRDASRYFILISLPYLFFALNTVLGNVLKAVGDMKTPLYANALANLINVLLNVIFIYKKEKIDIFGHSIDIFGIGWGAIGAGCATAISIVLSGLFMVVGLYKNEVVTFKGSTFRWNSRILKGFITVGFPAFLTRMASSGGRVIFTGMLARLGTMVYTAHALAFTAESAFYLPCLGFSTAVATLAGNSKGENNPKKTNAVALKSSVIAASVMGVMSIFLFAFAPNIMGILTQDEMVIQTGAGLLRIVSVNEPFFAVSVVMESVFNGIGRTVQPFVVSTITQWGPRVLGTFIVVYVLKLGINAAWCCMIADNILRAFLLVAVYIGKNDRLFFPAKQGV